MGRRMEALREGDDGERNKRKRKELGEIGMIRSSILH